LSDIVSRNKGRASANLSGKDRRSSGGSRTTRRLRVDTGTLVTERRIYILTSAPQYRIGILLAKRGRRRAAAPELSPRQRRGGGAGPGPPGQEAANSRRPRRPGGARGSDAT